MDPRVILAEEFAEFGDGLFRIVFGEEVPTLDSTTGWFVRPSAPDGQRLRLRYTIDREARPCPTRRASDRRCAGSIFDLPYPPQSRSWRPHDTLRRSNALSRHRATHPHSRRARRARSCCDLTPIV